MSLSTKRIPENFVRVLAVAGILFTIGSIGWIWGVAVATLAFGVSCMVTAFCCMDV